MLLQKRTRDGRKRDKLQARYLGPYEIAEDLEKGVFRLCNKQCASIIEEAVS